MVTSFYDLPYSLTTEQANSFERDGFLVIPDVLSPSDIGETQRWAAEVKDWPDKPGEHMPYLEKRLDGSMGHCR